MQHQPPVLPMYLLFNFTKLITLLNYSRNRGKIQLVYPEKKSPRVLLETQDIVRLIYQPFKQGLSKSETDGIERKF